MKKKLLALFLCCVMVFSLVSVALTSAFATGNGFQIYSSNGTVAETVLLQMSKKMDLTAVAETGSGNYQWQIRVSGDVWANIVGTNGNTLELSYGLVANALDNDAAEIRCKLTNDVGNVSYSNIVTVQIQPDSTVRRAPAASPAVGTVISEAQPIGEPVIVPADAPSYYNAPAANSEPVVNETPTDSGESNTDAEPAPVSNDAAADGNDDSVLPDDSVPVNDPALVNDTPTNDTPTPTTYTILINYIFAEDGKQAAPSWSATAATGSTYTQDIQSPVVVGYTPDQPVVHVEASEAKTYTVKYYPAEVEFTVKHYQQNVSNDEYTLADTETKTGYTESAVGGNLAKTDYTGFYSLLYDTTTTIAADGSTVVEIYYDRYYYLMNFDLDGGYGVEPIYARYGAAISVDTPTKLGYRFDGWSLDGTNIVNLPETMPAANKTYKAIWTANDTAKVTVVFWGENADDEEYSYIRSMQIDAKPGESYSFDGSTVTCPLAEHSHNDSELNCTHTHTLDCYDTDYGFSKTEEPSRTLTDNGNGIYTFATGGWLITTTHYYLNIGENWYCGTNWRGSEDDTQQITFSCPHTHTDACYTCGQTAHTHSSACAGLWKFVRSDAVAVAADGSSVVNVYYDRKEKTLTFKYNYSNGNYQSTETITAKWGSNISEQYKKIAANAGSTFWSAETSGNDPYTNYFGVMPQTSATYYNRGDSGSTGTMTYWGQDQNGEYTVKLFEVTGVGGYTVTNEDLYEFEGFTYDHGTSIGESCSGAEFYYTRNSYTLTFNDDYNVVKNETVKYEAPLSTYKDYVPAVPSAHEPGSVTFGGWYLNPEHTGAEYKLDEHTMPADNVLLYAKWVPVTHTVEFYLDKDALDAGTKLSTHPDITVPHGSLATPTPADPTNGSYTFVGWFYMENGVEKAFDFANMPVNKDLKVYGKWSINVLKTYTVKYAVQDTDGNLTYIAPDTTGSALAGTTKTFEAKTGDELNEGYRSGYFPQTAIHSLTIDIEGTDENKLNEFIFVYVAKEKVSYMVEYRYADTKELIPAEKITGADKNPVGGETSNAVITETFKVVSGYAPDAYQKRLVLSADEEQNVITFWYVKDNDHAPVQIIHWTQNIEGDGYTEYQSSTNLNGVINNEQSSTAITIPGFQYTKGTAVAGETTSNFTAPDTPKATLTASGLVLNLYYDRIEYPYEFRFLEQGTGNELAKPVTGSARYQAQVAQGYKPIPGYTLVSPENQAINIAIEDPADTASKNVKTFYYTEQTVEIKYEVVGPTGCGTLDNYQEAQLKVITGEVKGSAPTATAGFKFVGWYKNGDCTQPVDPAWVAANRKLTPDKTKNYGTAEEPVMGYEAATYYAKFEYDVADLTITKQGCENIDENQSFIFEVTGPDGYSKRVVINGNGSVTIKGLKIGTYTVTEVTNWSWRYTADSSPQRIELKPAMSNTVIFRNTRRNHKWLGGDAYIKNIFGK